MAAAALLRRFKPMFDRVLVERAVAETKTKGGILLPDKSLGKILEATVVAVGPGVRTETGSFIAPSVKVGDKILLPEYGGTTVKLEEKEYHLFRDTDILAKFED
ncbi:10 kDa heat shock protein, mitochondrial-like [Lineus longissimus]|uniref:10 kDa heat shock protein, mitochondrial-like n=1 Tax=Lineus longissimus TaxID=88925 RepID=UPI00315C73CA